MCLVSIFRFSEDSQSTYIFIIMNLVTKFKKKCDPLYKISSSCYLL